MSSIDTPRKSKAVRKNDAKFMEELYLESEDKRYQRLLYVQIAVWVFHIPKCFIHRLCNPCSDRIPEFIYFRF